MTPAPRGRPLPTTGSSREPGDPCSMPPTSTPADQPLSSSTLRTLTPISGIFSSNSSLDNSSSHSSLPSSSLVNSSSSSSRISNLPRILSSLLLSSNSSNLLLNSSNLLPNNSSGSNLLPSS